MSATEGDRRRSSDADREAGVEMSYSVPPAGEEIHLPAGSVLPLLTAIGVTLTLIGTTIWAGWSILGLIILVAAVGRWIRDVRHDVDALPDDHHH